jgi:hypothetical protein
LKEANYINDNLSDQLQKEQQAFEHSFKRHSSKTSVTKEKLIKIIEELQSDNSNLIEKSKELELFIDNQRQNFELKIIAMKDRVRLFKVESKELKYFCIC